MAAASSDGAAGLAAAATASTAAASSAGDGAAAKQSFWCAELKDKIVESFKKVARASLNLTLKRQHVFFSRHVQKSPKRKRRVQARELVLNLEGLRALVTSCPYRVPPVSFLSECLLAVDNFFSNQLTQAETSYEASQICTLDAMNGCEQYGYLRKLTRNNRKSKNKVLGQLKSLVRRKADFIKEGTYDFPDLSDSSESETLSVGTNAEEEEYEYHCTNCGYQDDTGFKGCPVCHMIEQEEQEAEEEKEAGAPSSGWIALLDPSDLSSLRTFFEDVADLSTADKDKFFAELMPAWDFSFEQCMDLAAYFAKDSPALPAANGDEVIDLRSADGDATPTAMAEELFGDLDEAIIFKEYDKVMAQFGTSEYEGALQEFMESFELQAVHLEYLEERRLASGLADSELARHSNEGETMDDQEDLDAVQAADSDGDGGAEDIGRVYPAPPQSWSVAGITQAARAELSTPLVPKDQLPSKKGEGKGKGKKGKGKGKGRGKGKGKPLSKLVAAIKRKREEAMGNDSGKTAADDATQPASAPNSSAAAGSTAAEGRAAAAAEGSAAAPGADLALSVLCKPSARAWPSEASVRTWESTGVL